MVSNVADCCADGSKLQLAPAPQLPPQLIAPTPPLASHSALQPPRQSQYPVCLRELLTSAFSMSSTVSTHLKSNPNARTEFAER